MFARKLTVTLALLAGLAHAQFLGYTAQQSTSQVAFTAQAANGTSVTFNNIGQSAHFLTYCPTAFSGNLNLEASTDGTFAVPVIIASSFNTSAGTCRVLSAGGYYPAVRAHITNYAGGSINVFYTGIAGPIAPTPAASNSAGPNPPAQCDTTITGSVAPSSNTAISGNIGLASQNIYICDITVSFTAAPSAGSVAISVGTICPGAGVDNFVVSANTPQLMHLTFPNGRLAGNGNTKICVATGAITATTNVSMGVTFY